MVTSHVPFVHGAQEGIDPKLMPTGWLKTAQNVRFRKDGRLGCRYGYDFVSGSQGQAVAAGNFGPKSSLYVKSRSGASTPAKWYVRGPDGNYSTPAKASCVGTLGVPRRQAVVRNPAYGCLASDFTCAGNYIFSVYHDADYTTGTTSSITLAIHNAYSGALVSRTSIGSANDTNPRIVTIGSTVIAFFSRTTDDTVRAYIVNSSTLATSTATVVTAHTGRAFAFDVAPNDSSTCLFTYQNSAVQMKWGTVSTAGVYSNKADQVIANPVRLAVSLTSSGTVVVVWGEGAGFTAGDVNYKTDTIAGAAVTAKTTIGTGINGFPVVGSNSTYGWTAVWRVADSTMRFYSEGLGVADDVGFLVPVSKPFTGPHGECLVWTVSYGDSGQLGTGVFGTYKLLDANPSALGTSAAAICEAVACQQAALPGGYYTTNATYQSYLDPRRSMVSVPTQLTCPSATAIAGVFPVITESGFGADLIRIDSSEWADQFLPCNVNGQLIFSGPRVREFDGELLHESGLADGPEKITATDSGASAGTGLTGGSHQVLVTWEWHDAAGRRHRSPPSLPVTVSVTAAHKVDVTIPNMPFTDKASSIGTTRGVYAKIWFTTASGTIFYLVNDTTNFQLQSLGGSYRTYTIDNLSDSVLATREVLYTQGSHGGSSGLLPNDEPPPCRFMWAGNDRVFMGGLEDPSAVQWSKLLFPGEPVQYSSDLAFRAHVDGEVTAVASLDGLWYVATRDHWFVISGGGPDDTGAGEGFSEPRKLPGEVGCISQRSVVEVADGLLFQGRSDQIYLLPRGGGAPVWVGQNVRDTLADFPFIAAARVVPEENVVIFSCVNTDGDDGRLIVYDTRLHEWLIDSPFGGAATTSRALHALDVYDGKLVLDGQIAQTSAFVDDESGSEARSIFVELETGDIRPFGIAGKGRLRSVTLLTEYRAGDASLTLSVSCSRDGFASTDYVAQWTVNGQSAGTLFEREYRLKYVRDSAFRFAFSVFGAPVEGLVFNGLTLEAYPAEGSKLLAASQRA